MRKLLFVSAIVLFGHQFAFPQKQTKQRTASVNYDSLFHALKWRNIGPFRGGRANAIAGVPGNDKIYFVGYTGGGVSKTDDGGITWRNISDGFFHTGSIGDIAVANSDPNVIYVGTGEHAVRGVMTSFGDGVYKSNDGGKTWKNVGLTNSRHISDVIIHPNNPDVVYVAAQGAVHGANAERGVFKSTDGGQTWKKVLHVDENTGASSLVMDPTNARILYAATWQHRRYPWKVESGGPGCAIWKSTDEGETWKKIVDGLPAQIGKIGLSVSRANPNRVYAIVEAEKSKAGLYRSDDGGKKWSLMSSDQLITSRSWYYMEVFADPKNQDVVYVLNAPMMRSIDGGKTFSRVDVNHGDTHDLWINPNNSDNVALADDGGGEITYNYGRTWSSLMNQPTAQFYRVNVDNRFPYWIYGGQQDNTSVAIKSRTNTSDITQQDWMVGPGCESAYIAFDPDDPQQLYGGCYQGYIDVLDTKTNETKNVQAYPSVSLAVEPRKMKYRFNWNAPVVASPHNAKTIYHAGNVLFKTTNGGLSWQVISPDLTRNDTSKQGQGGGPITNEGAGGENYNTIYYVIESSLEQGVIWTGSDCGLVYVTRDDGKNWTNVTPAGLPECMINSIELSPHDKATGYVCATRYKFNDFASYTYKTTNYGKTWTKINDGVDRDDFLRVIREDRKVKGLLYGGSERGFYISYDDGANWQKMQLNFPVVPVTDLAIHDNDLIAATAGRSFWILDDLDVIQQGAELTDAQLKLFTPKAVYRYTGSPFSNESSDQAATSGTNPLEGVILDYYLPEKADTNYLQLKILDANGNILRTYTSKKDSTFKSYPGGPPAPLQLPAEKGVNRFAWDFRGQNISPDISGVYIYGDYRAHRVAPGKYKARLVYKKDSAETEMEILQDPNLHVTAADWNEQQEFLMRVEKNITGIHTAINDMRKVKKQIENYNELMKESKENKDLVDAGKELIDKINKWEAELIETRQKNFQDVINWPPKLSSGFMNLKILADSHDPRITQGLKDVLSDLEKDWAKYKQVRVDELMKEVDAYNANFKSKSLPAIML